MKSKIRSDRGGGNDIAIVLPEPGRRSGRYVVTSSEFDFDHFRARRSQDTGPGHAMDALGVCLGAEMVQPSAVSVHRIDRLAARIMGQPQHWAQARSLVPRLRRNDLVYVTGEDAGLPIGLLAVMRR